MKLAIAAAVALVIAAAGCRALDEDIDGQKLEGEIRGDLARHELVVRSVECPSAQRARHGVDFACTVVTDHQRLSVHVIQTSDSGNVIWEIDGAVIDERGVGDAVASKLGGGTAVACPHRTSIYTTGDTLSCPSKHPEGTVDITFTDNHGAYESKLSPKP
jgi:hypothetical protein